MLGKVKEPLNPAADVFDLVNYPQSSAEFHEMLAADIDV